MKKFFSFIFAIVIMASISIPCFAASPSLSVKTSNAVVGETITISVNLSANSGLGTLDFMAKFNTDEFQLVKGSVKAGSLFSGMQETNESENYIQFSGIDASVVNKEGTVVSFQLKVLKIGGKISLTVKEATDNNYQNVSVTTVGATVKCSHANAKWSVIKNATCTEKGVETGTCSCGNVSTRDIPMLKHSFGEWKILTQATETQKGLKERTCNNCSKKETAEIAIIGSTETTQLETESETVIESNTETQTQPETTTKRVKQKYKSDNDGEDGQENITALIIVGIVFFALGASVGIGTTLIIIKQKSKEKQ